MTEKELYENFINAGQQVALAKQEVDFANDALKAAKDAESNAKAAILSFMKECGVKQSELNYEYSTIILEVKKGLVSVDVLDVEAVPQEFLRMKPEPDKVKIKEHLKDGALVNWATLKRGEDILTIRSKVNA